MGRLPTAHLARYRLVSPALGSQPHSCQLQVKGVLSPSALLAVAFSPGELIWTHLATFVGLTAHTLFILGRTFCDADWPNTSYVAKDGLEPLEDSAVFPFRVLGLKATQYWIDSL